MLPGNARWRLHRLLTNAASVEDLRFARDGERRLLATMLDENPNSAARFATIIDDAVPQPTPCSYWAVEVDNDDAMTFRMRWNGV